MSSKINAAKKGYAQEQYVVDQINNNKKFRTSILKHINPNLSAEYIAKRTNNKHKADVEIYQKLLGITIKSFNENFSFNQLERLWAKDLKTKFSIPLGICTEIEENIKHKIKNPKNELISDKLEQKLKKWFKHNIVTFIKKLFTRNEITTTHLLLCNTTKNKLTLVDLQNLYDYSKKFVIEKTKQGNLKIGPFISLQKKGGDGNNKKYKKSDLRHPGNQIQFKLNCQLMLQYIKGVIIEE